MFTLYFRGEWVTIMSGVGASKSTGAKTLIEASENHLAFCKALKEKQNVQRGSDSPELSNGSIHPAHDSGGVYDSDVRPDREGPNGNGGEERESLLPADSSSSPDEESAKLESQNPELK